jgi:hypothetical protein
VLWNFKMKPCIVDVVSFVISNWFRWHDTIGNNKMKLSIMTSLRPKVVGPFLGSGVSGSFMHRAALFICLVTTTCAIILRVLGADTTKSISNQWIYSLRSFLSVILDSFNFLELTIILTSQFTFLDSQHISLSLSFSFSVHQPFSLLLKSRAKS